MDELLTTENILKWVLGLVAMFVIYTAGVFIGASVKWFRENVIDKPPTEDGSDESRVPSGQV